MAKTRRSNRLELDPDEESDDESMENNVSAKTVSTKTYNALVKRSNKRVAKMKELLLYVKKLEKDLSDCNKELKSAYSDESSSNNNKDLNADLVTATKEIAKQVTWRTSQLVYSDEHAQALLLKVVKHVTLPDNINEADYVCDYADTLKRAIADGRQYCQAQLCKKTMGKYNFIC
jgi:adenylosuccinate synthase